MNGKTVQRNTKQKGENQPYKEMPTLKRAVNHFIYFRKTLLDEKFFVKTFEVEHVSYLLWQTVWKHQLSGTELPG